MNSIAIYNFVFLTSRRCALRVYSHNDIYNV
jgi:hypothetical protein